MRVTLSGKPSRYILKYEDGTYLRIYNSYNWLQLATVFGAHFNSRIREHSHEEWVIDYVTKWLDTRVGQVFNIPDNSFSVFTDDQTEAFVKEHGENYRRMIEYALQWLDEKEPLWNLDEPMDRAEFIAGLVSRCHP